MALRRLREEKRKEFLHNFEKCVWENFQWFIDPRYDVIVSMSGIYRKPKGMSMEKFREKFIKFGYLGE